MNQSEIKRIVQDTVSKYKTDKSVMTLSLAEKIAGAVLAEAERIGVKAVVCVSDAGGHPRLVKSMDDAYIASYDVAVNKAFTVVALKMSTIALKPLAQPGESLYGIQFTNGGRIVIFGGGDPLVNADGKIIGGLGVSGGSEEQDTALSAFGKAYFEGLF
ncbi:MAG: heme-binding protein [Clostridia bacterium]|nr:heme-binding protein [Clostridia bacterium]